MRYVKRCSVLLAAVLLLSACSSMRSVREQGVERAPHYRGRLPGQVRSLGIFPVAVQPHMNDWFNRDRGQALLPLLEAMDAYLHQYNGAVRMSIGGYPERSEPEITVGLSDDSGEDEDVQMVLRESGPTKAWSQVLTEKAALNGVDGVLWISVGVQDYLVRQKDWKGNKVLELGTGYLLPVPWLTSLDAPVEVLQVSGVLMSPDGKVLRSGAEGIIAKRTGFLASVFDLKNTVSESDIQALIHETVREDLPGSPLAWEAALNNLLAQLTENHTRLLVPVEKQR